MEFRVLLFLAGFASSVFSDLSGDQQNNYNFQANEAQNQQGFGQNMYGNKIPPGEVKPSANQVELQRPRFPMPTNGIPYAAPFYGQFQPMQPHQGSSPTDSVSESQPQMPITTPETYNHLIPPSPYHYQYPSLVSRPLSTPTTLAPHFSYGNSALPSSKLSQAQNQNTNVLSKPGENGNSIPSPLTYTYPVPIPMPFPSYFPYPQMQYPHKV